MALRELGPVVHISAEAIGQPGQRRFRICALSAAGDSASLWLEKEQLSALGDAIESVLEDQGYTYERRPLDDLVPDPAFPLAASLEMRVARLSMGLNREAASLALVANEGAEDEEDADTISVQFDLRRAYELRGQIQDVVAAGRPPCPLCTGPMDPEGHVCVKGNGHRPG